MVTSAEVGFVGLAVMIVLLFTRMPIGAVMGLVGFAGFAYLSGVDSAVGLLKTNPFTLASSYTFTVLPTFVLMGELASHSGIARDLYIAAHKWFGRFPGGLAIATVIAGAWFGALCGAAPAATAALGTVALPEMRKFKYEPGFAAATVAAAGTLAIIVPPSGVLIIYAVLTEVSIGKLFIAGVVPGLLLVAFYTAMIFVLCKRNPNLAPPGPRYTWRERLESLAGGGPMVLLFLFVMGGMYLGAFTPTEAGSLGAAGAAVLVIARRQFNHRTIGASLYGTLNIIGMIFMILTGAYIFSYFMAITNVPLAIANWIKAMSLPALVVVAGIMLAYFVLGWAMDELTMMVLTTPLFFPVLMEMGIDPVWWGIMVMIAVQQGALTPPVGITVNIICGITKGDIPTASVFQRVLPYVACLFGFMILLMIFPDLALWLPGAMK